MPSPPHSDAPAEFPREERLRALSALPDPGARSDPALDRLTALAKRLLDVPVVLLSLVGSDRQSLTTSEDGLPNPTAAEGGRPLSHAVCQHVVAQGVPLVVEDARAHLALRENPAVAALGAVGYLGVPVRATTGETLGALCAITREPRAWHPDDVALMEDLAALAETEFALRTSRRESQEARAEGERRRLALEAEAAERAGAALRESEAHLRHLLDSLFAFVAVLAPDGTLLEVNQSVFDASDVRAEDVYGKKFWDCYWWTHDDDARDQVREACGYAAQGESSRYDVWVRVSEEGRLPLDFTLRPLYDGAGRITHLIASAVDISARIQTQRALQSSEERLRLAAAAARFGSYTYDVHTGAAVWSPELYAIYGLAPDEPVTADRVEALIHPDDRALWGDRLAGAEGLGEYTREYRIVRPDGEVRWVADRGRTLLDGEGSEACALHVTGMAADITDRKRAEEALHLSQSALRLVLDTIPQGVFWKDLRGRFLGANRVAARASGFADPSDLVGLSDRELPGVTPEQAASFQAMDREVMETGRPIMGIEEPLTHPDRSTSWLRTDKVPLRDTSGRIVGLLGTWEDITHRRETVAALRESEERLGLALDVTGLGQWALDLDTGATSRSPRHDAIFGYPEGLSEWTYEQFLDHVVPEDRQRVDAAFQEALARGETWAFECRIRRADGDLRWIAARGRVWLDESGQPRRMVGTVADITPRRQAEEALRESEERLRAVLDATDSIVYTKDLEGRFTLVNQAWADLVGKRPDEVVGQTDYDFFPRAQADAFVANDRMVREAGRPVQFEETAVVNGERRTYFSVKFPLRDESGAIYAVGGISSDISPLKQAEDALRTSEEQFRSTFENAAVGMAHVGPDGSWLRVNERLSEIVGYSPEEFFELTFQDITHPDDLRADLDQFDQLLAGEIDRYQMEKRYVHKDGRAVWILLTVAPDYGPDGEVEYVISIVEDISDKKAAEEALYALNEELEDRVAERTAELARSNAELDQFAYVASHDLKAPLRAIDSLATWIAEDAGDLLPEESARHLALLRSRTDRMEGLLDGLLAYSRVGRQEAAPEPVDTADLVQETVALVAPPEGFDVRTEGDFPTVVTARTPLSLVFRNLIGNAIKHHDRPDGRITVSAACRDDGWVEFAVEDDGPGIPPAYRDRVFGMFQTLRPRDEVEGSGMGLAVVKKTVEARGGAVVLEEGRDGGARFRFTWPHNESA